MFWYLATPYTKYKHGIHQGFQEACRQATLFLKAQVPVFSPIAHMHPLAMLGNIPVNSEATRDIWLPSEKCFMDAACGLVVCKMDGWDVSEGVLFEIQYFTSFHKPILYMEPGILPDFRKAHVR